MRGRPTEPLSRAERYERARAYLQALGLRRYRAWIFGSVARGDFTKESDTDVLIVSDALPEDRKQRLDLVFDARVIAPEIEPVAWLGKEWKEREARGDPFLAILTREAVLVEAQTEGDPGHQPGPSGRDDADAPGS